MKQCQSRYRNGYDKYVNPIFYLRHDSKGDSNGEEDLRYSRRPTIGLIDQNTHVPLAWKEMRRSRVSRTDCEHETLTHKQGVPM